VPPLFVIVFLHFSFSGDGTVENLRKADSYVSHYSTSKNQCACFGSFPNRNMPASALKGIDKMSVKTDSMVVTNTYNIISMPFL